MISDRELRFIKEATDDEAVRAQMIVRREAGEPLQYVIGKWPFLELELTVDSRALIPRPETEEMVEYVRNLIPAGSRVLDLGTGSGAIAIALADVNNVVATDLSQDAISLARENAASNDRIVEFRQGSWFDPIVGGEYFDLIITNPPYVPSTDQLDVSVTDYEPHSALFAGDDGLDDLRYLVPASFGFLLPGAVFVTELDPRQADEVVAIARLSGFSEAYAVTDMTARKRWVVARR